jgi:hypothetical protein
VRSDEGGARPMTLACTPHATRSTIRLSNEVFDGRGTLQWGGQIPRSIVSDESPNDTEASVDNVILDPELASKLSPRGE